MKRAVLIPVYNEAAMAGCVIDAVRAVFEGRIIVVDDGSTDATAALLAARSGLCVLRHDTNLGYGQSLIDGFALAHAEGIEALVTMDCDGQHEPGYVSQLFGALVRGGDIISGSRYLPQSQVVGSTPPGRREVNAKVTAMINEVTGWSLTDAFCGFKAYRVSSLARLMLTEAGYALPVELLGKAWRAGLTVREVAVPRVYFDHMRVVGTHRETDAERLELYRRVWARALGEEPPHG